MFYQTGGKCDTSADAINIWFSQRITVSFFKNYIVCSVIVYTTV